ncbi:hypothetical protein KVR01_011905 [Diaporthe batatas]|uniref:uncharacterized protein n=1 Tax=Diaporthe batatas TaxID=748121 RepID=UPI001D039F48|nr:uncharacterized protein KVR01_011905 [Diaporthe batatas]KAG8158144.1 hypothetical protein KVR01_011905 [Diaporthe batatas]
MYLRNIFAAASFVAMVASAALPEDSPYVPGFDKSCVESCKAGGTANDNCYGWCPQCDASLSDECLAVDKI